MTNHDELRKLATEAKARVEMSGHEYRGKFNDWANFKRADIAAICVGVLELLEENQRLREALLSLYDAQNGPPLLLPRHKNRWESAMKEAGELLGYEQKSPATPLST